MPEERKLVTILFADVTGSTALGEDLDPEDVRALMGRYYEHARQVVADHGGTLEKFIGDAVMAVFGLPHAHGDDAERAVAAAVALRDVVRDDSILAAMSLRIGVNTGEVVATSDPTAGDFLVTGDAVNVAARLQQSANPGEIVVSERTRTATQATIVVGASREIEVKGKREPLRVFAVEGVRTVRLVERPPLVDRKQDLLQLALLRARALEEHRPQLVSLVAPAGTGKTRLLEEFLAQLDPEEGWQVAVGRCPPYGQTLTYWPLRGLLEALVGEIERERLVEAFVGGGHRPEDASTLASLILTTLGIESEGQVERESIFAAWRLLIETLAKDAPQIVVFEDLHWASDTLLDLVEHVTHPHTRAPLLMMAISRPELLDRRPNWGSGTRQSVTTVVLEPLSESQTAELVEQIGASLPAGTRHHIVERSGGNPFFATELVRGLAERGLSGETVDVSSVPDTVHAAVLARLDALSPAERAVVQAASVAGRSFRPATLAAVMDDIDLVEITTAIDGLLARDMAMPADGGAYTFRHVLIRDVAYGTLSRSERIRMHGAVAAWLEEYAADRLDEFVELIAYHYREAVTLARRATVSPPAPIVPARAVTFLERAGELANRSGAYVEGRNHFHCALELAPPEDHARLYEKLGECESPHSDGALSAYRRALESWRRELHPNPLTGARIMRKILVVSLRWFMDKNKIRDARGELISLRAESEWLAMQAGSDDELWRLRVVACWWHVLSDPEPGTGISMPTRAEAEEGKVAALSAAQYFEKQEDWESFSVALDAYSALSMVSGANRDVVRAAKRRRLAPSLPPMERGDAVHMVAWGHYNLGEYEQAIDVAREALAELKPGQPAFHLVGWLGMAAAAARISGRWTELEGLISTAMTAVQEMPANEGMAVGWYFEALCLGLAREDRPSMEAAATVLSSVLAPTDVMGRAWLAALVSDDPDDLDLEPEKYVYEWQLIDTISFLSEHGAASPPGLLHAARTIADAWRIEPLTRFVAVAEAMASHSPTRLAAAIDNAEQHGLMPHAARMRIVLAQMIGDPTPLEQARTVLERLEDRQFLRRLDEVTASLA